MDTSDMDNDTRGWIMCGFSGLACIAGASVICIDIPIRLIPSKRNFRIQESNAFLASSLSLSFGVMLFSALYSMLPTAMRYLAKDDWDDHQAGFLMMGCFIGGFFGVQVISRVLHQYMPSHVVDCDHTHDSLPDEEHGTRHVHRHPSLPRISSRPPPVDRPHMVEVHNSITESTPLILAEVPPNGHIHTELLNGNSAAPPAEAVTHFHGPQRRPSTQITRPSMNVRSRVMSFFKDTKANCDEDGPCFGYSDPCGQECFKHIGSRSALSQTATPCNDNCDEECDGPTLAPRYCVIRTHSHDSHDYHSHDHAHAHAHAHDSDSECCEDTEAQHHHHVPANAFLSIGLQSVIAIALHKFPEGFITYATNHANPSLGLNVFMALFVHNIAEGFAMALPLYMALGSRVKAIFWSSLLGGFSQPLGAAAAVAWFKLARRSNYVIDSTAYACLFAVTAGIMVSVALQLFVESLSLNHNRNLSIFFAFLGMALLGMSNALVTH
ncbi:Zinc/iron permease [Chaetomidium leptoderma]|uniref:Zinc/iron permease n=1 Tax=Chaetomidium leptoderma TaxID=669021 RepID=A0AAN6VVG5_9PEZI|nr:Zinc/iron permease [Chaetomidium leptoderma]